MATSGGSRLAISVQLLVLLLLMVATLSSGSVSSAYRVRNLRAIDINQRQSNQIPNCNAMLLESQCSRNPKCRWCRSDALDDMCFARVEAWRLPTQIFSCN